LLLCVGERRNARERERGRRRGRRRRRKRKRGRRWKGEWPLLPKENNKNENQTGEKKT
jgi:hypothetical protein